MDIDMEFTKRARAAMPNATAAMALHEPTKPVGLDDALTAPERRQQPLAKALFRQSRTATVLVGDPI
jgi:hypothetical protein